eukprot:scaffold318_cov269-Pinguiococcus_pyrenoidosus.AAC.5
MLLLLLPGPHRLRDHRLRLKRGARHLDVDVVQVSRQNRAHRPRLHEGYRLLKAGVLFVGVVLEAPHPFGSLDDGRSDAHAHLHRVAVLLQRKVLEDPGALRCWPATINERVRGTHLGVDDQLAVEDQARVGHGIVKVHVDVRRVGRDEQLRLDDARHFALTTLGGIGGGVLILRRKAKVQRKVPLRHLVRNEGPEVHLFQLAMRRSDVEDVQVIHGLHPQLLEARCFRGLVSRLGSRTEQQDPLRRHAVAQQGAGTGERFDASTVHDDAVLAVIAAEVRKLRQGLPQHLASTEVVRQGNDAARAQVSRRLQGLILQTRAKHEEVVGKKQLLGLGLLGTTCLLRFQQHRLGYAVDAQNLRAQHADFAPEVQRRSFHVAWLVEVAGKELAAGGRGVAVHGTLGHSRDARRVHYADVGEVQIRRVQQLLDASQRGTGGSHEHDARVDADAGLRQASSRQHTHRLWLRGDARRRLFRALDLRARLHRHHALEHGLGKQLRRRLGARLGAGVPVGFQHAGGGHVVADRLPKQAHHLLQDEPAVTHEDGVEQHQLDMALRPRAMAVERNKRREVVQLSVGRDLEASGQSCEKCGLAIPIRGCMQTNAKQGKTNAFTSSLEQPSRVAKTAPTVSFPICGDDSVSMSSGSLGRVGNHPSS